MHKVEIVVHVDDVLEDAQQTELINALREHGGVEAAHFTPGRAHLLVIDYDRDQLSAQDVLECVRSDHLRAELVGPI
jgi:prophage DNA circulation protein